MVDGTDPALTVLAGLRAAEPPAGAVADRVFARWATAPSRMGTVYVAFTDHGVAFVRDARVMDAGGFRSAFRDRFERPLRPAGDLPDGLAAALAEPAAAGPPLDLRESSAFERSVLATTRRIPPGRVHAFGWVATLLGRPHAARAVAAALAGNPVPLLVPCHRVVYADGRLGDHVFGMAVKEALLRAEGVEVRDRRATPDVDQPTDRGGSGSPR